MDLTEEEDINKRWQEYIKDLYKRGFNDPDNHNRMVLIPLSCTMSQTSVHSSSGTLIPSDLIPSTYLSLPLYNRKGFDLDHT